MCRGTVAVGEGLAGDSYWVAQDVETGDQPDTANAGFRGLAKGFSADPVRAEGPDTRHSDPTIHGGGFLNPCRSKLVFSAANVVSAADGPRSRSRAGFGLVKISFQSRAVPIRLKPVAERERLVEARTGKELSFHEVVQA